MEKPGKPAHYADADIDPWAVIDTWPIEQQIGFHRGNALKYLMRMGAKDAARKEVQKAIHYCHKLDEVLDLQAETAHIAAAPVVVPPPPEYDPASVAFPFETASGPPLSFDVDADGWITWHGGHFPVDDCQPCYVRLRGGEVILLLKVPGAASWLHRGNSGDIIAYKPATTT